MSAVYKVATQEVYHKIVNNKLVVCITRHLDGKVVGFKYIDNQAKEVIKSLKHDRRHILLEHLEEFNEIAKPIFDAWEEDLKKKLKLINKMRK